MKMRTTMGAMLIAVCCGMLVPAAAKADAQGAAAPVAYGAASARATGFLLEGVISASTTISPIAGEVGFTGIGGTLRAGWMFDAFALALEFAYGSITLDPDGDGSHYTGIVAAGPVAQIFLWQTADRAAGLYALAGLNLGAVLERFTPSPADANDDETFAAILDLGFGGCYFLHPNFSLGVEVGAKTTFVGIDNSAYLSAFFAALTIGFVAG
jgi:hypothetical protein